MKNKRFFFCLLALFLIPCHAFAAASDQGLRVGTGADGKTLDPQNSIDTYSHAMARQVYESLFTIDGKNRTLVPILAESWEQPDPETYIVRIKQGVLFHNGEELTADDVVFSLKRLTSSESLYSSTRGKYINPEGLEVIDKYTVRIKTNGPIGNFLAAMKHPSFNILNEKATTAAGKDYFRNPVGTGPYKFVRWVKGERVEFEAFDGYHGEKPILEKMSLVILPDDSSRVIALETDRIDMAYALPFGDFARLSKESKDKLQMVNRPGVVIVYLGLNTQSDVLKDPRVRLAIDYAIDKKAFNQVVYQGYAAEPKGPLPTVSFDFPEGEHQILPYDIKKAKALLKEAGIAEGTPLTLWIMNSQDRVDGASVIQSMLSKIGFKVEVQVFENSVINEKLRQGKADMFIHTWGMQTSRDPGVYWEALFTKKAIGTTNLTFTDNDELDSLITTLRATTDPAASKELGEKIWQALAVARSIVPLSIPDELIGARLGLVGFEDFYDGKVNYLGVLHYAK